MFLAVQSHAMYACLCVFVGERGRLARVHRCSLITSSAVGNRNRNHSFSGFNRFLEKEEDDGNLRPEAERILGVTGSVLHPCGCILSCQRPQRNKLNPDTSLSEVPTKTHTDWRLVQYCFLL